MTSSVGRPRPVQLLSLFMSGALYKCFLFLWAAPPPDMILFFPAALAACFYFRLPPLRADACLPDYCNIKRRKCLSKTGVCGDGDCENCVFLPFICQNRGGLLLRRALLLLRTGIPLRAPLGSAPLPPRRVRLAQAGALPCLDVLQAGGKLRLRPLLRGGVIFPSR